MKIKFKRNLPSRNVNISQYSFDTNDDRLMLDHLSRGKFTNGMTKDYYVDHYELLAKMHNCELYFYSDFKVVELENKKHMNHILVFDDGTLKSFPDGWHFWAPFMPQEDNYKEVVGDINVKKALRKHKIKLYKDGRNKMD